MGIYYWPPNVPRRYTTEAYIQAFETVGYARGSTINDHLEVDHEKVAIYATFDGAPRHAARQVPSGAWTSKLGQLEDIEHFLDGLVGNLYGAVVQILRRPRS
jgi:hypothetical protein